jgi:hypothetical protein
VSAAKNTARHRVVVDGSNIATEGRTVPSLSQLDEAVRAYLDEHPNAEVIVVADATFEHRVAPSERSRFKEAELAGEIVTPPAGAIGRGDAFILKIADRIDAVVLSNDSFQEFHDEYPWLFEVGRLTGGKPVAKVGWVFTPRLPVRGVKAARPAKKLSVALPHGVKPVIGTTLTPVKSEKSAKVVAKRAKASVKSDKAEKVTKSPKSTAKATKKTAGAKKSDTKKTLKSTKVEKATKVVEKSAKKASPKATPVVALRRGRQPVNPEAEFRSFISTHKLRSVFEGEVTAFTSHGAVIKVPLRGGKHVECYAPTMWLGNPAPTRARDVLARGDKRSFRLLSVDKERRIAELALS